MTCHVSLFMTKVSNVLRIKKFHQFLKNRGLEVTKTCKVYSPSSGTQYLNLNPIRIMVAGQS